MSCIHRTRYSMISLCTTLERSFPILPFPRLIPHLSILATHPHLSILATHSPISRSRLAPLSSSCKAQCKTKMVPARSALTTQPYGLRSTATSVIPSICVRSSRCCAALMIELRGGLDAAPAAAVVDALGVPDWAGVGEPGVDMVAFAGRVCLLGVLRALAPAPAPAPPASPSILSCTSAIWAPALRASG